MLERAALLFFYALIKIDFKNKARVVCLMAPPRRSTHEEDEQGTGKGRHAGLGCRFLINEDVS